MLIENAGYKGIYVNKVEAVGYSTNDLESFIKQRTRWACGCIQMAKKYKILRLKGLNLKQKMEYLSCVSYWLFSLKRILYLITPILYSIFNIIIIKSNILNFIIMWLPQYILKRFVLDNIYENNRSSTWNKIYETILSPVLAFYVLKEIVGLSKKKFEVSKKKIDNKASRKEAELFITHFMFLIINCVAYIGCLARIELSILPLIWSLSNILYLLIAIIFDTSKTTDEEMIDKKEKTEAKYSKLSTLAIFKEIQI